MRLREFASAEEQMALWRLVSDNVWASIGQQVKQERQQRAEKAALAKVKAKRKPNAKHGKSIGAVPMPTSVPVTKPKIAKPKLAHTPKPDSLTGKQPSKLASTSGVSSSVQALPTAAASSVKAVVPNAQQVATVQAPASSTTVNASNDSKDAGIWRNTAVQNKVGSIDYRHSVNGLRNKQQTLRKPITR